MSEIVVTVIAALFGLVVLILSAAFVLCVLVLVLGGGSRG